MANSTSGELGTAGGPGTCMKATGTTADSRTDSNGSGATRCSLGPQLLAASAGH